MLHMHSLEDGSLVRRIGSKGSGKGQFNFNMGGLCVSPDGDSVLVAECYNNRVQEVRVVDGSWVRFVGTACWTGHSSWTGTARRCPTWAKSQCCLQKR